MSSDNMVITRYANQVLKYDWLRYFLMILTAVLVGYTLQPVPEWLNNLFNNSVAFKFIVLLLMALVELYPLDDRKIILIIFGSIAAIVLFEVFRRFDTRRKKTEEEEHMNAI